VWTHLDEARQFAWRDELVRVLRPGGYALVTLHGTRHLASLQGDDRRRFEAGEFVARTLDSAGTNGFMAYHPEAYVREHFANAELTAEGFFPWGATGVPGQDIWVFRRR
jgi:hypothetical protein